MENDIAAILDKIKRTAMDGREEGRSEKCITDHWSCVLENGPAPKSVSLLIELGYIIHEEKRLIAWNKPKQSASLDQNGLLTATEAYSIAHESLAKKLKPLIGKRVTVIKRNQ